ncbi:NB-ARC domain containing protein [Parasponia andersonii]|uniref:NB-ARC domain containing protein n=1 Tax=Parasponia andersonii TaxID=3476 RepID=A0A2P5BFN0_PARAD|nr:NB-ARC domain containing protein [Parasponia andersonii]
MLQLQATCNLVKKLPPLSREMAWELFCKKAFRFEIDRHCSQKLEQLSNEILRKCEGLPLVIVTIAGLLSTKEKLVFEWQKVLQCLNFGFANNPCLSNISNILSLSYYGLPYHLRSCPLYFSMFPTNYVIPTTYGLLRVLLKKREIRHWKKLLKNT